MRVLPPPYMTFVPPGRIFQWLCGVFTNHRPINYSNGKRHGHYCRLCAREFGNPWKGE